MPYRIYANIGSNQGDREAHIEQAVALISNVACGGRVIRSAEVETEPWGFVSANKFLNVGIVFSTSLSPHELLDKLQEIERKISPGSHRDSEGNYVDRDIDIDIILIDDLKINTPRLTVPHPRMTKRDFVMIPLKELSESAPWLKSYLK